MPSPAFTSCLRAFVVLTALATAATTAQAQSTSALLNEALDKQVALQLDHVLPQAIRLIQEKTGVRIEADPAVYELLPWGEETNIKASVQNMTLREALTAISKKLGLRFELGDNAIRLEPIPALKRSGKRATLQELQLLDILQSTPLKLGDARPTLRQIIDSVDAALVAAQKTGAGEYVVESRVPAGTASGSGGGALETIIPVSRNATLAEGLEAVTRATGVTWYPWGNSVVVLPKEDQIRILLQKPITVRYAGADVGQVLLELSKLTKVPFAIEPGAVQRIPPEFRTVRLIVDNATVQQVLEQLSATTGLGWVVTDKNGGEVYIWNNSPIPGASSITPQSPATPSPNRGVLLVPQPDGSQLVLPESELPEDVREYLKQQRKAQIEKLRDRMKKEGFTPSTQPTEKHEDL